MCVHVCACELVCVCAREHEGAIVCVHVCMFVRMYVCAYACARMYLCTWDIVYMGERERTIAVMRNLLTL